MKSSLASSHRVIVHALNSSWVKRFLDMLPRMEPGVTILAYDVGIKGFGLCFQRILVIGACLLSGHIEFTSIVTQKSSEGILVVGDALYPVSLIKSGPIIIIPQPQ